MPSLLRIVGALLGLLLVWLAVRRLRRAGSGSRVPATGLLVVGLGLIAIAAVPDLVRPIQDILGLSGEPLGRLVTVLVVSVAIAYFLVFYALARADRANQRVSRLVRALSIAQVETSRLGGGRLGGVLVCIPAFEEADNLPGVLAEIPAEVAGLPTHVLVIDDGSRDATVGGGPSPRRRRRQPPGQQRPGRRPPDWLPGRGAARRRCRRHPRCRRAARPGRDGAARRADRGRNGRLRRRLAPDGRLREGVAWRGTLGSASTPG